MIDSTTSKKMLTVIQVMFGLGKRLSHLPNPTEFGLNTDNKPYISWKIGNNILHLMLVTEALTHIPLTEEIVLVHYASLIDGATHVGMLTLTKTNSDLSELESILTEVCENPTK